MIVREQTGLDKSYEMYFSLPVRLLTRAALYAAVFELLCYVHE